MIIGDDIFVMLLVEKFFKTFTPKPIADAKKSTEALVALSFEVARRGRRDRARRPSPRARNAYKEPKDHGFMYQWGFEDLDGHIWEVLLDGPERDQELSGRGGAFLLLSVTVRCRTRAGAVECPSPEHADPRTAPVRWERRHLAFLRAKLLPSSTVDSRSRSISSARRCAASAEPSKT